MGDIETDLKSLLAGEVVPISDKVDLKLKTSLEEEAVRPVVKRTVTYIVMAMVFDDRGRIILIQEAKESCYGKWYPPAGRVEPGENLVDAVKREVREEAGVEFVPQTVVGVKVHKFSWIRIVYVGAVDAVKREVQEEAGVEFEPLSVVSLELVRNLDWFRVCYVGKVIGGELKTLEQKDSESLQAGWFSVSQIKEGQIKLRYKDFFGAMEIAQRYQSLGPEGRHPCYAVGIRPYHQLIHRPVILRKLPSGSIEVLYNIKKGHLPSVGANPQDTVWATMAVIFMEVFSLKSKDGFPRLKLKGLLTLEHCGVPAREHDGMCMTTVYKVPKALQQKLDRVTHSSYAWVPLTDTDLCEQIRKRVLAKDGQFLMSVISSAMSL